MKIPYHLGIIIDGNRRWAKKRGLPAFEGHRKGLEKIKTIGKWCKKRGVKILTLFAFSTENWSRSKTEVQYLMRLLRRAFSEKNNKEGVLNIAISYGGRAEIIEAVKNITKKNPLPEITEDLINQNLWTAGEPDPDLIIRTGDEKRISNFLLWQAAYSELYFSKKYWPDFTEEDLDLAFKDYNRRQRRFGK